ncbi:MAG: cytochrome c oxidase assembly protein [Acidimicrobiales bacterium]
MIPAVTIGFGDVSYVPHPEVWMLLVGSLAIGWYASRVLEPKAVAAGYEAITRNQRRWFGVGFVSIWLASDWPVHDVAENYLYSVHMLQHMLLSMLIPAAFVLATPRWLLELVIDPSSRLWRWFRTASKPLVAGIVFNCLTMWLHWSRVVQISADSGVVHFLFHLMIFVSGLLMWMPVFGPITEWRLKPLSQCIYLFSMSLVPTIPGGWLVFATGVVYGHYDTPERLWGIDVLADQQAAGVIMKLLGGFVLWAIILVVFTKWAKAEMRSDEAARDERARLERVDTLTYEQVSSAFATTPAPSEPH